MPPETALRRSADTPQISAPGVLGRVLGRVVGEPQASPLRRTTEAPQPTALRRAVGIPQMSSSRRTTLRRTAGKWPVSPLWRATIRWAAGGLPVSFPCGAIAAPQPARPRVAAWEPPLSSLRDTTLRGAAWGPPEDRRPRSRAGRPSRRRSRPHEDGGARPLHWRPRT